MIMIVPVYTLLLLNELQLPSDIIRIIHPFAFQEIDVYYKKKHRENLDVIQKSWILTIQLSRYHIRVMVTGDHIYQSCHCPQCGNFIVSYVKRYQSNVSCQCL